jgi:hypothetical protein
MDVRARLIRHLNAEWQMLLADPILNALAATWDLSEASAAGLMEACRSRTAATGGTVGDATLLALLRIAASDPYGTEGGLAARVVLQRMLPWATWRVAHDSTMIPDVADREATVVTALIEVIGTYPTHRRPRAVVTNIRLDALRLVRRAAGKHERATAGHDLREILDAHAAFDAVDPLREVLETLAWALKQGVLSRSDVVLLSRRYLREDSYGSLAADLNVSEAVARQRISRLVRRLAATMPSFPTGQQRRR